VGLTELFEDGGVLVPAHIAARYERTPNPAIRAAAQRTALARGLDQPGQ
jgi:hypothetical protein